MEILDYVMGRNSVEPDKPDQTKTATPTTQTQVIYPDAGYELASVTINPTPLETKTVTPTTLSQTIEPTSPNIGFSQVTVNAVTSSIDNNITEGNIKNGVSILGITGTYGPEDEKYHIPNGTKLNRSTWGSVPNDMDFSNVSDFSYMFAGCSNLTTIPQLDMTSATNMSFMCQTCTALTTFPVLNISSVDNLSYMFVSCTNLTDTSLDNILQTCISTTLPTIKSLRSLGLNSKYYPESRIQALPHYQAFINAGWTIETP